MIFQSKWALKYAPSNFWPWGIVFLILPKPEKLNFNELLRVKNLKTDEKWVFPKNVQNQFCNMLSYVKNALKTAILSVLSQTFQNDMFLSKYILTFFRFFDILKPHPISFVDQKFKSGFGVVLDDLIAGVFAGLTLLGGNFFIQFF